MQVGEQLDPPTIESTKELTEILHKGQTDRAGYPAVSHALRTAENVRKIWPEAPDNVIMAALLHDVLEDQDITANDLLAMGYSKDCVEMVELLTKPKGDGRTYNQYITDLINSGNRAAMIIKMADNMDNLAPERLERLKKTHPSSKLEKRYQKSLRALSKATGITVDIDLGAEEMTPPQTEYYIFDGKPVLITRDEEGLIDHAVSYDPETGALYQNDGLINHLEKELTEADRITAADFSDRTNAAAVPEIVLG